MFIRTNSATSAREFPGCWTGSAQEKLSPGSGPGPGPSFLQRVVGRVGAGGRRPPRPVQLLQQGSLLATLCHQLNSPVRWRQAQAESL